MDNFKLVCNREGHLHFDGLPTGYWIERGHLDDKSSPIWYLQRFGMAHKQFATFKRKKDVLQAAHVFIEGMAVKEDESKRNAAIRALQLCLKTGSTNIIQLSKSK